MELTKAQFAGISVFLLLVGAFLGVFYSGYYGYENVYFHSGRGPQKQIGFEDPNLGYSVVCNITTKDQVKVAGDAFSYSNMTSCSYVDGRIGQKWANDSFESYNTYEAVQCMKRTGGNRTKCVPE